jgi:hypothetical protein
MEESRSIHKIEDSMDVTLSEEDKKRIKNAEYYEQSKTIMKSFEDYAHVNVGEVYSIVWISTDKTRNYVRRHGSGNKTKFLVVHKDEGFVFAKAINSSGGLGKDVVCLTIRYPSRSYELELDDAQAEAIIFSKENDFDPFKEGKQLAKKKNKARNLNKKKIIAFSTEQEAYNFATNLKIGDTIYDANTAFGEAIVKWQIKNVIITQTDKTPMTDWNGSVYAYGKTNEDQIYNKFGFTDKVLVEIEAQGELPKPRRWISRSRTLTIESFLSKRHRDWYSSRPLTIDDV